MLRHFESVARVDTAKWRTGVAIDEESRTTWFNEAKAREFVTVKNFCHGAYDPIV